MKRTIIKIIRWTARTLSAMVILFHAGSFFGDLPMTGLSMSDQITLFLWGLVIVGLIIAWKWEGIGGLIILGVTLVQYNRSPELFSIWVMWIAPFTAMPFLLCWLQTRKKIELPSMVM